MTGRHTFQIDNQLIQRAPTLFAPKLPSGVQMTLPGLDNQPLGPFDEWAAYALFALLDPQKPAAAVRTTPTRLIEVLGFAREVSNALAGYKTFSSDSYQMLEESLHRLYSVEIHRQDFWTVKTPGKKGRPKKQLVVFRGRILISYSYIYPEGVTQADLLPSGQRVDINRARDLVIDAPPIWKATTGPKPEGIEYRIHPELVRGLSGEDPHIGTTTMPFKIFDLRKTFGRNPTATRVLVWTIRQTNPNVKIDIDALVHQFRMDNRQPGRNREGIIKGFSMLKEAGVVDDLTITEDTVTGKKSIQCHKVKDWYLPSGEASDEDIEA